jgi:hypothetical protein
LKGDGGLERGNATVPEEEDSVAQVGFGPGVTRERGLQKRARGGAAEIRSIRRQGEYPRKDESQEGIGRRQGLTAAPERYGLPGGSKPWRRDKASVRR